MKSGSCSQINHRANVVIGHRKIAISKNFFKNNYETPFCLFFFISVKCVTEARVIYKLCYIFSNTRTQTYDYFLCCRQSLS